MMKVLIGKERELDSFCATFDEVDDFLEFLREKEDNTERFEIPANEVKFSTIEHCLKYYKTEDALAKRLGVSTEVLKDTQKNTNIIVAFNKNAYLLGSSAWVSLRNRINIYGDGLDKLGSELQTAILNKSFSRIDENVKVIVSEKKVRAIMSDEYTVVPASELFKEVLKNTENRFNSYKFVASYVDHNVARCKVLLTELKEELNEIYNLPDKYTPGIIIETSDTGFSANKIGAYWRSDGGGSFISDEYIYMVHKGGNSLQKVIDELPNLFIKYQNTVKKFATLMTIEIRMPVKVLRKACRHIGIPKKYTRELVAQFELNYQNVPTVTAYDICREILSVPLLADDSSRKTLLEEKAGRAINLNYRTLDEEDE